MINILLEEKSLKILFYLIFSVYSIITIYLLYFNKKENNNDDENKVIKKENIIIGIFNIIIFSILLMGIVILYKKYNLFLIKILSIAWVVEIIIFNFIKIANNFFCYNEKEISIKESISFLLIGYYIVLLVLSKEVKDYLSTTLNNYYLIHNLRFEVIFILLLYAKILFIVFLSIYITIIILKFIHTVLANKKNELMFVKKIKNIIYNMNDPTTYYKFNLTKRIINKKRYILIIFSMILDALISIIYDIVKLLFYFITPIIIVTIELLKKCKSLFIFITQKNISHYIYKWGRISIIIAFYIEYAIIKLYSINIKPQVIDVFEVTITVIVIPVLIEQILSIKSLYLKS